MENGKLIEELQLIQRNISLIYEENEVIENICDTRLCLCGYDFTRNQFPN